MFIGHYAVGLAAKRVAPKVSIGMFFLSVQFLDLIWPILLLLGFEHVLIEPGNTAYTPLNFIDYPFSHSLLTSIVWAIILGCVYFAIRRYGIGALMIGLGVVSHWILDFITHRPDLPLAPWSNKMAGLGLWNSVSWSIIVEGAIYLLGVIIYSRFTEPIDRIGKYGYWSLVIFLPVVWIANFFSVPPNEQAMAYSALLLWLLIPWGYWIDKHRQTARASE
jgi:membrane-bound metal-dependent hydrolase YbcI (DUF457 family)